MPRYRCAAALSPAVTCTWRTRWCWSSAVSCFRPRQDSGFDRLNRHRTEWQSDPDLRPGAHRHRRLKADDPGSSSPCPAGHRQQGICAGRCGRGQRQPGRLCGAAVYHGDGAAQSRRGHDGQPTGCLRQCRRHGRDQRQPAPKGHTPGDHHRRPIPGFACGPPAPCCPAAPPWLAAGTCRWYRTCTPPWGGRWWTRAPMCYWRRA